MNLRTSLKARAVFSVCCALCAVITAQAATISVSYALSGTASGDPTNPPLMGNATGSLLPLGSITWRDLLFPDLTTGAGSGTFTMTFANGDTLFGNLCEQLDLSSPPNAPFTQIIDVTGGTGAFLWYNGTLTGGGTGNLATGTLWNAQHDSRTWLGSLAPDRVDVPGCVPKAVAAKRQESVRDRKHHRPVISRVLSNLSNRRIRSSVPSIPSGQCSTASALVA
jgi:hypothetical protein